MTKDDFVRRTARGLDLPSSLVENMTEPCTCGAAGCEGWRLARLPWPEELKEYGLEGRFAAAGWRTALRSLIH